jgi:nucleotide-binding universal stress UspA family protein
MKSILVLTDFSENAANASKEALWLAEHRHTDLLLYNSYIKYPSIASYAGGSWKIEECIERKDQSKEELKFLAERLKSFNNEAATGLRNPAIHTISEDNDLGSAVARLINENDIELIVMGARNKDGQAGLFGHDINTVIEHATCPVLILPGNSSLKNIAKIFFASNYIKDDIIALSHSARFAESLNYDLAIVHVDNETENSILANKKMEKFEEILSATKFNKVKQISINGKNVISRLNRLLHNNPGNMLAMVHTKRTFFTRLFHHSTVKEAIENQKAPLLIFPLA